MKLEGIHHITAITADAPRQRRVLHRRARPADGQEDGQPGRPDRLPPVLRRRARPPGSRPHVLRVPRAPRRAAPGPAWCTGSCGASARRRRSSSGPRAARPRTARRGAGEAACSSPTPRASSTSCGRPTARRPPLSASTPRSPPSTRCRASTACAPTARRRTRARALLGEALGFDARDGRALGGARRAARRLLRLRPRRRRSTACRARAPSTTSPWSSQLDETEAWRSAVAAAAPTPTPVIDRFYFRSVYFREPSGVLFEIATIGPGFAVDEAARAPRRAAVAAAGVRAAAGGARGDADPAALRRALSVRPASGARCAGARSPGTRAGARAKPDRAARRPGSSRSSMSASASAGSGHSRRTWLAGADQPAGPLQPLSDLEPVIGVGARGPAFEGRAGGNAEVLAPRRAWRVSSISCAATVRGEVAASVRVAGDSRGQSVLRVHQTVLGAAAGCLLGGQRPEVDPATPRLHEHSLLTEHGQPLANVTGAAAAGWRERGGSSNARRGTSRVCARTVDGRAGSTAARDHAVGRLEAAPGSRVNAVAVRASRRALGRWVRRGKENGLAVSDSTQGWQTSVSCRCLDTLAGTCSRPGDQRCVLPRGRQAPRRAVGARVNFTGMVDEQPAAHALPGCSAGLREQEPGTVARARPQGRPGR